MTGLIADEIAREHDTGWGHPECSERFDAVMQALKEKGILDKLHRLETRPITWEEMRRCHTPDYLSCAEHEIESGAVELSTGDTVVCGESWRVATRVAGGVLNAVDAVVEGRVSNAFCAVRPPGHHATPDRGMGFCVLNNIALAARHSQARHGIGRVLIVDWDVHHGNGTQDIFYEDETVYFFSTHQSPLYPGTGAAFERGAGAGKGTTMNCPVRAGAGREEILGAFRERLLPEMERFRPEMVFVSAGFDSRLGDPLGGLRLTDSDFHDLTQLMCEVASQYAGGRLVSVLEGGYDLFGLGCASAAHVEALLKASATSAQIA